MPELMRAHPYLAVFRDCQIGVDFRLIDGARAARQHPFMRPDIILTARHLGAGAGMNHDEGVDESIAVIVIGRLSGKRGNYHITTREGGRRARYIEISDRTVSA